jgi:twinkle protein
MLVAGQVEQLKRAVYDAQSWRPDSILGGDDLWEEFSKHTKFSSIRFPHNGLNDMLAGWRDSEITLIGAGSGSGKSTFIKELCASAILQGDKVGAIFLEESPKRTVGGFVTPFLNVPVNLLVQGNLSDAPNNLQRIIKETFDSKVRPNLEVYNHFGIMDPDILVNTFRYMAVSLGCKTLVLDHITMLANTGEEGNERGILDGVMNRLRSMVQETSSRMIVVSHLKRPSGRPYEEGAPIHLGSFRGSTQLVCLSDNVLALERNQQHPQNSDFTRIRGLKCRISGYTGIAGWAKYDKKTGRMLESEEPSGGILGDSEGESGGEESY